MLDKSREFTIKSLYMFLTFGGVTYQQGGR